MRKFSFALNILAITVFSLAISSVAQAQASRTWVSGVGDDVNPCSRTAPCKTFAGAISKTAAGGEIDALDPGGFGAVTITKSMTIDGTTGSGFGSILAAGSNGVIISALSTDVVTLRNLSINGVNKTLTPGVNGVRVLSAARVHIDNCTIFGFGTHGVDITLNAGVTAKVTIQDSTIEQCTNSGVNAVGNGGSPIVNLENVKIDGCSTGVNAGSLTFVVVHNSAVVQNTNGVVVASGSDTAVDSSNISAHATNGILVASGGTARIGNNLISQNPTGVANSGTCQTTQDNRFVGNTNDVVGTGLAPILKK